MVRCSGLLQRTPKEVTETLKGMDFDAARMIRRTDASGLVTTTPALEIPDGVIVAEPTLAADGSLTGARWERGPFGRSSGHPTTEPASGELLERPSDREWAVRPLVRSPDDRPTASGVTHRSQEPDVRSSA